MNSNKIRLENGDAFESKYAEWIRANLPWYEIIWTEFIGHDGHGWPLKMKGLTEQQAKKRKKFYQAHYSFAVDCYQIERLFSIIEDNIGKITDIDSFLNECQNLFLFMAYIGHIRDMFGIIDKALGFNKSLSEPMQKFYAQRSHVLHGPRLPIIVDDGSLKIPQIAGPNRLFGEWDDKSVWEDVDKDKFKYTIDYCKDMRLDCMKLINDLHAKIYNKAKEYFSGCELIDHDAGKETNQAVMNEGITPIRVSEISTTQSGDLRGIKTFTVSAEG